MKKISDFVSIKWVLLIVGIITMTFAEMALLSYSKQEVLYEQAIFDEQGKVKTIILTDSITSNFECWLWLTGKGSIVNSSHS